MKLYRQSLLEESADLELLAEGPSVDNLRQVARKIAMADGCLDFMWTTGSDANQATEFPIELVVEDRYRLIIRSW